MNPNEPKPDIAIPDKPEHLKGAAAEEWDRVTAELKEIGVISQIDRPAISAYCYYYGQWLEADKIIREEGMMATNGNGKRSPHPLLRYRDDFAKLMTRFITEFGMTPASRSKVSSSCGESKSVDPKKKWEKL